MVEGVYKICGVVKEVETNGITIHTRNGEKNDTK